MTGCGCGGNCDCGGCGDGPAPVMKPVTEVCSLEGNAWAGGLMFWGNLSRWEITDVAVMHLFSDDVENREWAEKVLRTYAELLSKWKDRRKQNHADMMAFLKSHGIG